VLTPTRELSAQITKAASLYGKFSRYKIVSLVGGMSYHHQINDLSRGADIIVATPGRLLDHIQSGRVDLSHINMLVLDEADRMLDMGFIDDVEYIAKLTPKTRQTLLFSATVDKKLATVVRHLLNNPVRIDLSNEKVAAPDIKQELYKVSNTQQKSRLLKQILGNDSIYKAIIFSGTKINADRLANELQADGFAAAALHGDLRQNVRNRTVEQLRNGKIQFLVATDVAARGIDISDITHVINYDLPKFSEDYVHRIGRTGRAGKSGVAISFVAPSDLRSLQSIERFIGQRLPLLQHNGGENPREISRDTPRAIPFERDDNERGHKKKSFGGKKSKRFSKEESSRSERFSSFKERSSKRDDGDFKPRGEGRFARSERPARGDSKPRGEDRFARSERSARGDSKPRGEGRFARSERPARGDSKPRGEGRFARTERPARGDSKPRSEGRFARTERPARGDSKPRGEGRFARSERPARGDSKPRGEGRFARTERPARGDSKPRGEGRFARTERPARGDSKPRGEGRFARTERPAGSHAKPRNKNRGASKSSGAAPL